MKRQLARFLSAAAILASAAVPVAAADWGSVSGTLAVTSDYRFRGISQNDLNPAPQGSINWNGEDGFYAGTWASAVNFNDHADTSIEWDIYGGKHFDLGDGFDLNVEPYYYAYPNHDAKKAGFDDSYFEMIGVLSRSFGDLSLAGTVAWSPNFFAETGNGWWINANAAYKLNDWLSVSGNLGHQWVHDLDAIPGIGFPYSAWDLGATASWKDFALDVRYVDSSISKSECAAFNGAGNGRWCTATVVATLTYNFSSE
jgi:uncharacterized protein (TIGR02001 family)